MGSVPATVLERRLTAEWALLEELARLNPERLAGLRVTDLCFELELRQTPAFALGSGVAGESTGPVVDTHMVTLRFPLHFPAAPLELYLARPMFHPNMHPETGFVCLWDRHRVSHNVEHALHKLVAMLGWRLLNRQPVHVMQPAALLQAQDGQDAVAAWLRTAPLVGVVSAEQRFVGDHPGVRRRRLS